MKSGVSEKDGHTLARNTQRYNRHSRYPETWPGEIFSLDLGNLIEVRLCYPLPSNKSTTQHPLTWGPELWQCARTFKLLHPESWRASASIGSRSNAWSS